MVITASEIGVPTAPAALPKTNGAAEPTVSVPLVSAPAVRRHSCPRCSTRLVNGYDEPQCLTCGYADYVNTRDGLRDGGQNVLSTATRYILRYVGEFPTLAETLAHVKLIQVRNRVVFAVNCPFCEKAMDQSSLSGKRPEAREQRYKCMEGHRVSLVPVKNGMLGWR